MTDIGLKTGNVKRIRFDIAAFSKSCGDGGHFRRITSLGARSVSFNGHNGGRIHASTLEIASEERGERFRMWCCERCCFAALIDTGCPNDPLYVVLVRNSIAEPLQWKTGGPSSASRLTSRQGSCDLL